MYNCFHSASVTGVQEQGVCTSGYAFSTVGTIESARHISRNKLAALSAQQIIDCSSSWDNNGCVGGHPINSYKYIESVGLASEQRYPYLGFSYKCKFTPTSKEVEILGCATVQSKSMKSIMNAVSFQPVAVSLNSGPLKDYSHGVFKSKSVGNISLCKHEPNHWMMLVGYGRD